MIGGVKRLKWGTHHKSKTRITLLLVDWCVDVTRAIKSKPVPYLSFSKPKSNGAATSSRVDAAET